MSSEDGITPASLRALAADDDALRVRVTEAYTELRASPTKDNAFRLSESEGQLHRVVQKLTAGHVPLNRSRPCGRRGGVLVKVLIGGLDFDIWVEPA